MGFLNPQTLPSVQLVVTFFIAVVLYKLIEKFAEQLFSKVFPGETSKEFDEIVYLKNSYARLKADFALVRSLVFIMAIKLEIDPGQLKDLMKAG